MSESQLANAMHEGQHHTYEGHGIPWFVRLMWLVFWAFALGYVVNYLLPAMQSELLSPP